MSDSPSPQTAPPLSLGLNVRLSMMMFLQYAIWGAWLPLLFTFLFVHRGFTPTEAGWMFSVGAVGAILAPFVAGQIADRYFATQRFLGISHLIGAVLVWQLANIETFKGFLAFSLVYSLVYSPTLPLTNSLAFHHLPDRDRDFGKVRLWGTIGWIAVGIGIGQWLYLSKTLDYEAAAERVVAHRLADEAERTRLLEWTHFTLKETKDPVVGRVLEESPNEIKVQVGEGEDAKEVAIDPGDVASRSPYYATLAAGTAENPDEPTAENIDLIRAALVAFGATPADSDPSGLGQPLIANQVIAQSAAKTEIDAYHAESMAGAFRLSAILGLLMGVFCLFGLPHTPPAPGREKNAPLEAIAEVKRNPLATLFLLSVPISCIHQFYFVHTAPFLGGYQTAAASFLNKIFGVGGGGLMTIGQISEVLVLGAMPFLAKALTRKTLLGLGIVAYGLRMAIFAYGDAIAASTGLPVVPVLAVGVALHGLCFGCFVFVAFMIVDEQTTPDVRASAQSLFNLVIIGFGTIVGSLIAGEVKEWAGNDYTRLFSVPMWGSLACLAILLFFYPGGRRPVVEPTPGDA